MTFAISRRRTLMKVVAAAFVLLPGSTAAVAVDTPIELQWVDE